MLVGGRKVSYEIADFAKKEELLRRWKAGDPTVPQHLSRNDWNEEDSANGLSLALGGGFDVVLNRAWAWRVANLEYTRSWLSELDTLRPQEGLRFTSGVVLRIGTW